MSWGYELIIDARAGNASVENGDHIRDFAKRLVDAIDMTAYGEPQVVHFGDGKPAVCGYTLVQLIETSSITAHFVDGKRDFFMNIFSCKMFDRNEAVKLIGEVFEPEHISMRWLERTVD